MKNIYTLKRTGREKKRKWKKRGREREREEGSFLEVIL